MKLYLCMLNSKVCLAIINLKLISNMSDFFFFCHSITVRELDSIMDFQINKYRSNIQICNHRVQTQELLSNQALISC